MKSRQTSTRRSVDCDATVFPIIGTFCTRFSNRWKLFQPFFQSLEKVTMRTAAIAVCLMTLAGSAQAWDTMKIYGSPNGGNWTPGDGIAMTAEGSYWRKTIQKTDATGNWYFRFYANTTEYGPSPTTEDAQVSLPGDYTCAAGNAKALYVAGTQNRYYTFTVKNESSLTIAVQETENAPVSIAAVSDDANFIGDGAVTVSITASATPSSGEDIYVVYTTDSWTNRTFVKATGSGTAWTAQIPDQGNDTAVTYYIMTTTFSPPIAANCDLQTIAYGNNNGSNYSYVQPPTIVAKVTFEDYSPALLNGQSGASDVGLSGAWYGGTNSWITGTSLLYQAGNVRISGGTNAVLTKQAAALCASNTLSTPLTRAAGTTAYMGFLFRCEGSFSSTDKRYVALDSDATVTYSISCGIDNNGEPHTNMFLCQLNNTKTFGGGAANSNQTYYLVVKMQADASAWTNVTLFINPTNRLAEQAENTVTTSASFTNDLSKLLVQQAGMTTAARLFYVDQITIGKTWGDVVYSNESPALVVLYSFSVADEGGVVVVRWRTASENDTVGFYVERWDGEQFVRLNSEPIFSPQNGMGNSYSFTDVTAVPGNTYTYRLIEIEGDCEMEMYGPFDRTASALQIQPPITAGSDGMVIRWLSREDEAYNILRATDLLTGFETIASAIPATPPENAYTDTVSGASGFYRIEVNLDE